MTTIAQAIETYARDAELAYVREAPNPATAALRRHVTGRIAAGLADPIVEITAAPSVATAVWVNKQTHEVVPFPQQSAVLRVGDYDGDWVVVYIGSDSSAQLLARALRSAYEPTAQDKSVR